MATPLVRRCAGGFTLVEVMVALVVMSVLAVMAWQGIDGIVRTRDISTVKLDQTLRLGTVLMQWDQDLAALQETSAVPDAFVYDGATARIVRRTDRGLQVVVWSLRPGLDGTQPGKTLLRWVSLPATTVGELQDQWFRSQQLQGTEAEQVRVIQGVAEWQMYCFVAANMSNCQSDQGGQQAGAAAAPGTVVKRPLPDGVRLELSFSDGSANTGKLTRDTRLGPRWQ